VERRLLIIILMVVMLVQASFCFAEAELKKSKYGESYLKAGTTEVSVNFTGAYNSAGPTPFIGYFVSDEIEIGGGFMMEVGDYDGKSYTSTALTLLGRLNTPIEQNLVVFGEVGLEQVNVKQKTGGTDKTAFILGVGGRVFPSKAFSMNFTLDYIIGNYESGNSDVDSDSLRVGLGLSVFIF